MSFIKNFYKIVKKIHNDSIIEKRKEILQYLNEEGSGHFMSKEEADLKLWKVAVMSSHNSYLSNYQNFDFADLDVIEFLIKLGVRCLEFDVYYRNGKLLVGHGTKNIVEKMDIDIITTNMIKLDDIFKLLKRCAFKDFSDMPLIINLELLTRGDKEAHSKIAKKIRKYFYGYILGEKFFWGKKNLGDCYLKHLRKRIIFITGRKLDKDDELSKYINAYTYKLDEIEGKEYDSKKILNFSNKEVVDEKIQKIIKNHINNKGLVRIYPAGGIMTHFSYNYDFWHSKALGAQIVCLNLQQLGDGVEEYFEWFQGRSIKHLNISFI